MLNDAQFVPIAIPIFCKKKLIDEFNNDDVIY